MRTLVHSYFTYACLLISYRVLNKLTFIKWINGLESYQETEWKMLIMQTQEEQKTVELMSLEVWAPKYQNFTCHITIKQNNIMTAN